VTDVVGVGANSVDFVYRLPSFPAPDSSFAKLRISEHLISCGGQVTTALATCAAMGLRTSYIGTIGSDRNGDAMRELSAQFLALAAKQSATVPLMNGHRIVGVSLVLTGDISEGRECLDRAITLYDPVEHPTLAARFAVDMAVSIWCYRSIALWLLGYPDAALADTKRVVQHARGIGQAASLMFALHHSSLTQIQFGHYAAANADADELTVLAEEKDASLWKASGLLWRGCLLTMTGKASDAIPAITAGLAALRSTGSTMWMPLLLTYLARAHSALGQSDEAWRCIGEAMTAVETTKERWCESEVNRVAGEISLRSPDPDRPIRPRPRLRGGEAGGAGKQQRQGTAKKDGADEASFSRSNWGTRKPAAPFSRRT